ncbi:MAG TPA: hypothetical protein PLA69_01045 [Flavobacterium sp.]|nr:hypothetical protein [Flavobacterium sp.]
MFERLMMFIVTYLAASGVAVYHAVKEDQPVYWVSTITAIPYLGPILFFLFKKDMEKERERLERYRGR